MGEDSALPTAEDQRVPGLGARVLTWSSFLTTYLPALVLALGTGIAVPAIPPLAKSFDVGFGAASSVVTVFLLGGLVGTLPAGWLVDRFGRRSILIAGPVLTSVTAFLIAGAHSFPELVAYRFVGGAAAQMWLMARLAAISQNAPPDQRGRQVSWMFGMDNSGKVAGPLVGGLVAGSWGMRAPFVLYGVLALLATVPAFVGTRDEGRRDRRGPDAPRLAPVRVRRLVWSRLPFFGIALFAGLTRGPISADLLHLYAAFTYGLGPRGIGYLATGAAVLVLPIGFVAGSLLDRYGRRRTMVPGFVSVAVTMGALAVCAFAGLPLLAYVVLFLLGVSAQALTSGSVQTIGADVAPAEARGRFLGLWRFTGQGGQAISPVIFAGLATGVGYGASFAFCALTAAVVAALVGRHVDPAAAG